MKSSFVRMMGLLLLSALPLNAQEESQGQSAVGNDRYVVSMTYMKGKLFRVLLDRQTKMSYVLDETVEQPHLESFTVDKGKNTVRARVKGKDIEISLVAQETRKLNSDKGEKLEAAKARQRDPNSEGNKEAMAWLLSKPGNPVVAEDLSDFPESAVEANIEEGPQQ